MPACTPSGTSPSTCRKGVPHHPRPVGLRQDDAAAHDRRLPDADRAARSSSTAQPVSAVPPHKRSIGMVFQRLALFPHMTAAENVAFPLKMRRFDARTIPERVERYLDLVQARRARRPAHPRAVRRPAAARRDRPRAGLRAGPAAARRAARRARPQAARGDAARVPPHPARARRHHDQRHPRPARGAGHVRRDHRHGQAAHPAEGAARRDLSRSRPTPSSPASSASPISSPARLRSRPGGGTDRRRKAARGSVGRRGRPIASAPSTARRGRAPRRADPASPARRTDARRARHGARRARSRTSSSRASASSTRSRVPICGRRLLRVFDHDPARSTPVRDRAQRVHSGWNARDLLVFAREPDASTTRGEAKMNGIESHV